MRGEQARQMSSLGLRTLAICKCEWPEHRRTEEMDADTILKVRALRAVAGRCGLRESGGSRCGAGEGQEFRGDAALAGKEELTEGSRRRRRS